jgi:hypothetical protein
MPLADIVIVVLRLFAIQTFVQALSIAASATASLRISSAPAYISYLPSAALVIFAVLEWVLAPAISRVVTRAHNPAIQIGTITREDLYSFAFVFLGLYFILVSVAPTMTWLHFYLFWSARAGDYGGTRNSFYDLASHLITLFAGILALVPARKWARKLMSLQIRASAG